MSNSIRKTTTKYQHSLLKKIVEDDRCFILIYETEKSESVGITSNIDVSSTIDILEEMISLLRSKIGELN